MSANNGWHKICQLSDIMCLFDIYLIL